MYRVGFLGWKWAAFFGLPLLLRIEIVRDENAHVFIATSPDLAGLVAEEKTLEDLFKSVRECTDMLLEEKLKRPAKNRTVTAWTGEYLPA
jgi:predicted RNase H-like HicB family nuclease